MFIGTRKFLPILRIFVAAAHLFNFYHNNQTRHYENIIKEVAARSKYIHTEELYIYKRVEGNLRWGVIFEDRQEIDEGLSGV